MNYLSVYYVVLEIGNPSGNASQDLIWRVSGWESAQLDNCLIATRRTTRPSTTFDSPALTDANWEAKETRAEHGVITAPIVWTVYVEWRLDSVRMADSWWTTRPSMMSVSLAALQMTSNYSPNSFSTPFPSSFCDLIRFLCNFLKKDVF